MTSPHLLESQPAVEPAVQAAPMSFTLSTAAKGSSGFDQYRELYAAGADAGQEGPNFQASARAWRLDRLVLFDRRLRDVSHQRLNPRVRRDGFEHFTVQLNLEGEFHASGGDGFARVKPGEVVLMDMTKPMRSFTPAAHIITASIAREVVESAATTVDDLHGLILPASSSALLADYMRSLTHHAAALSNETSAPAVRAFAELLGFAIDPSRTRIMSEKTVLDHVRREAAKRFIEAYIGSVDLDLDAIGRATGVSRATLYRVFEGHGGVGKYIRTRRLAKLRALLADISERRPLSELATICGFSSESHCSRAFQDAFDMRPGEFRRNFEVLTGNPIELSKAKLGLWIESLR